MVRISVVIPTFNRPDFLREAVACVLAQSYTPYEIIVVNNGTDSAALGDYLEQVTVYDIIRRAGAAQARNFGAVMASGDYVAFLDDDDLWEPDYLGKAAEVITEENPDCLVCRLDKLVDGNLSSFKNAVDGLDIDTLLIRNPGMTGSNIIARRTVLFDIGGYDPALRTGEDKALIIECLLGHYQVMAAPHIQAIVRKHNAVHLSNAESGAIGLRQFLVKYGYLMNAVQRNFNLMKIYRKRYLAFGRKVDLVRYWYHRLSYFLFKIFAR
jgi:glycosyltransferase involved in cell wall biosynthesis